MHTCSVGHVAASPLAGAGMRRPVAASPLAGAWCADRNTRAGVLWPREGERWPSEGGAGGYGGRGREAQALAATAAEGGRRRRWRLAK